MHLDLEVETSVLHVYSFSIHMALQIGLGS